MKINLKINRLFSLMVVFCLSLLIAVGCNQTPPSTSTASSPNAPVANAVKHGFSAWPGWFPWQIAQEQKIFDANNVKVDLKWFDGYLDSINSLAAGQLDSNSQTLNDTISSVAAGSDQVVVLVNDNSTGNDQIIVREGINSVADLKGKTIAVEAGTVDHFLLLLGLKKAGLTASDVQIKPLETGAAAAAFVAGQVDAVGVFAPFTTQALKREKSKTLFTSKEFPGAIPDHLVVSRKMVQDRPQEVQAMVNSWFATLDYIQKNQAEAIKSMAKRAGVSEAEYKEYNTGTTIFSIQDNLKAFSTGTDMTSLPFAAEEISKFLLETGLMKTKPDLSKIFDDRFVKAYAQKQKT